MAAIEWDWEKIQGIITKLDSTITVLESQKSKLEQLTNQVDGAWQSMAGSEYSKRIGEDLQYIKDTIASYREIRSNLDDAKKTYAGCEGNIHTKLISLYSNLSV